MNMQTPRAITLLHLSDTQFGRNHRFGRLGLPEPDAPFDTLFARLCDDLRYLKDKHGLVPDLVIASGDLAEWGKKKEFEHVLDLLTRWSRDTTVRLWDPGSGHELQRSEGHGNGVQSVAFSPDGQRLASGSWDNTVRLWDPDSGRLLATLIYAPEGWAAVTPDGRYKLRGGYRGRVLVRNQPVPLRARRAGPLSPRAPPPPRARRADAVAVVAISNYRLTVG